eukprot:1111586-Pelagomonas_calceolata.AAC.5
MQPYTAKGQGSLLTCSAKQEDLELLNMEVAAETASGSVGGSKEGQLGALWEAGQTLLQRS